MLFSKLFWIRRFLRVVICQSKCQHEYWLLWGQYYLKAGLLESLATSELCGLSAYSYNHFRIWKSINLAGPSTRNQGLARDTRIVLLTLSQHALLAPANPSDIIYVMLCTLCKVMYIQTNIWIMNSLFKFCWLTNRQPQPKLNLFYLQTFVGNWIFCHVLNNLVYHLYLYLCLL